MTESKNIEILAALLTEPTIAAAARKCGVDRSTVYERLSNPEFRAEYEAALETKRKSLDMMGVAASEAAYASLNDVLRSSLGTSTAEKLKAAEIALKYRRG